MFEQLFLLVWMVEAQRIKLLISLWGLLSKAQYILKCILIIESDLNFFLANLALTTASLITGSSLCYGAKLHRGKSVLGSTICCVDFHRMQTKILKLCITQWSRCKICRGLLVDAPCLGSFVNSEIYMFSESLMLCPRCLSTSWKPCFFLLLAAFDD